MMPALSDGQGRQFKYLRLSLTDVCNFRCAYCLPNGYKKTSDEPDLSLAEITRLLKGFARLGFRKVRLTGGEPTLRPELLEIVSVAAALGYQVAMTTNAYRLKEKILPLKQRGLSQINISMDSLRAGAFKQITGKDELSSVLATIDEALAQGLAKVKVNTVLIKGFNELEFADFLNFIKDRPLTLRFIELMQTAQNKDLFTQGHVRSADLIKQILDTGWSPSLRTATDGPAEEFWHPDSVGKIGFISPYQKDFCATCNRLRVSAKGGLRLCLFGHGQTSLRPFLQDDDSQEALVEFVQKTLHLKPEGHGLQQGDYGDTSTFSSFGG